MIPTALDLASAPLVHRFGDLFNPPGLTNFLGTVQTEMDILSIRSLLFPPLSGSDYSTGGLFIDGRYFPSVGSPITFTWYPDRIVREAEYGGLKLSSTTIVPFGRTAAAVQFEITNISGGHRTFEVRLGLRGGVTEVKTPWTDAIPPAEYGHDIDVDRQTRAVCFTAKGSGAVSVQGTRPAADRADSKSLAFDIALPAGAKWSLSFVNALGSTLSEAKKTFESLIHDVPSEIERARIEWNRELEAVFTPSNDRFSGSLPLLETSDAEVLRIYQMSALGVVYFKRDSPHSAIGRAYDTLMPRYWSTVTFLWDYSLSSLVHALLDPTVMRKYLKHWMRTDIHSQFGTEWLTGGPVGQWYSVNDYAMTRMLNDYLRWTGDHAFASEQVAETKTVLEHLMDYATNWKNFRTSSGLADYGGINNLLECVSTYIHEVASLNAGNVWSMRTAADILEALKDGADSRGLREEANGLAREVNKLYIQGKGFWNTRHPDGSLVPVRHCYDFITALNTISGDLSSQQRREMTEFFVRELRTPTWMHALSCDDPDAMFSIRPDHQWTGAYPAWPPLAVTGLWSIGEVDLAFEWLKGLARSANQGPYGQAHFAESVVEPDAGGARKAPSDFPWINDWTCSSSGAWANIIIESIFGIRATVADGISASPKFGPFDKDARLRNLAYQGKLFDVDANGIHPSG